jgi:hypothetical protein
VLSFLRVNSQIPPQVASHYSFVLFQVTTPNSADSRTWLASPTTDVRKHMEVRLPTFRTLTERCEHGACLSARTGEPAWHSTARGFESRPTNLPVLSELYCGVHDLDKFQDYGLTFSQATTTSCHKLHNSLFTNHPTIPRHAV